MKDDARDDDAGRTLSLVGATGVGVGSIVGGGILVLAGIAFDAAGPSAILAFSLNGVIAVLTALSFAEMAAAFPQSGGAYLYAKKVLSVRAAFAAGWVLWFAYLVAGALYGLGFAEYFVVGVSSVWRGLGDEPPSWLSGHAVLVVLALLASATYALMHIRRAGGGGQWENAGKLVLFTGLVAAGGWALARAPSGTVERTMTPFFAHGTTGFFAAMGFTFITVQGFDLIAAVGGEVRSPVKNLPRAMLLAIAVGMVVYVPLLVVIATVGPPSDTTITQLAAEAPAVVTAAAVRQFAGPAGYWVIVTATVLATLSALSSNVLAASRVALSMARDRTLPRVMAQQHAERGTPVMAIYASGLAVVVILLMVPDVAAAGAAASLIFLVSFALVHLTAYLARRRAVDSPFKTPLFPLVPALGGGACLALAIFQAIAVPAAGAITAVWLGLGVILYYALFAGRAQAVDAFQEAHDPRIAKTRGRRPLVLAPVANPASAAGMAALANALAPPRVGRVVLLTILRPADAVADGDATPRALVDAQAVIREAITVSLAEGHTPEAVVTIADDPWAEIARAVAARQCESLLLGVAVDRAASAEALDALLNEVACDVVVLHAPTGWTPSAVDRIVVPIGGRGGHDELRARLLGSLGRAGRRPVRFVRVVGEGTPDAERDAQRTALTAFGEEETHGVADAEVIASDAVVTAVARSAGAGDLLILGLQRHKGRRLVGEVAMEIARATEAAVLMISHRG